MKRLQTLIATVVTLVVFDPTPVSANQSDSTVSLACSENTPVFGQTVTFTATVTAESGSGVPTGTVTFKDGATLLGTTMLMKGSSSYPITSLTAGTHRITATYNGDSNFAASSCKAITFTVNAQPTVANTYVGTVTILHEGIVVGMTQTNADGKFEFKGLKAGKYYLGFSAEMDPMPSTAPTDGARKQSVVRAGDQLDLPRGFRITNVRANANLRVEGLTELVGDDVFLSVDPETGRSLQALVIPMDGGTILGAFKIADNESPRPQDRARIFVGDDRPHALSNNLPADTENVTIVVGKFVLFKDGNLTLLASAKEGEEPKLTEFLVVAKTVLDPADPINKRLPVEEAFKDLPVGTPVKVETNTRGETAVFIIRAKMNTDIPSGTNVSGNADVAAADPNAWRYKQHNGEWWYYGPDEKWLVYRNGKWTPYPATGGTAARSGEKTFLDGDPSLGIFDRWGNLRTPGQPGAPGGTTAPGAGIPGSGSPIGGFLPGRQAPSGPNIGGAVRGAFGGKK